MIQRRVQFSEQGSEATDSQTWPRSALKSSSQPPSSLPAPPAKKRKQKVKAIVIDVYRGYRTLDDVDSCELLHDLVKDPGDNALMTWTVMNMILRTAEARLQINQTPELGSETDQPVDLQIDVKENCLLVERAATHFDVFSMSADVLDNRVLSQIMRTVELLWVRATREGYASEISTSIDVFVERCINLIRAKPSSKSLATTAVRVINIVDWSFIGEGRVALLVTALSKTQLAFASSFAAESLLAYTTAARLYPSIMVDSQREWIPTALRALFTNSTQTRNQALSLLQSCNSPELIVDALNDATEANSHSDALARIAGRRILAMLQVASSDDAKVLMQIWCLVMKSVGEADKKWQHLELWLDIAKMAFHTNLDAAESQWDSYVSISSLINRPDILLYPFDSGVQLSAAQCSNYINSAAKTFRVGEDLWDGFLESVLKMLGQSKNENHLRVALLRMESILRPVRLWLGSNIGRVLNVCMVIFRNPASPSDLCANVWRLLAQAASSRPQSMELLRFHYKLLSLELPVASSLTSTLIETWSLKTLTEKAKSSSYSILSLILLPITSFGTTHSRVEYVEKNIMPHFKTLGDALTVLRVLLNTVVNNESQQSSQLDRWCTAALVILNAVSQNRDRGSQSIMADIATLFNSLFISKASRKEWDLWARLLTNLESPDNVLGKIRILESHEGFEALLCTNISSIEKNRLVADSLSEGRVLTIKKATRDGIINSEFVDNLARIAVMRFKQQPKGPHFAISLLHPARVFIVAQKLLSVIKETHSASLVGLWNTKVAPNLSESSSPFLSGTEKDKLVRDIPALDLPGIIIKDTTLKREPVTPLQSESKRPRRRVLTGSIPPSLSTPPPSSDPIEDNLPSSADELCSSPPRQVPSVPSWHSAQERARVLKRVIMGLNMQDAMQGMKRTECEMIYNLLFRACVDLHTHLSDTAPSKPEEEVAIAREELDKVLELRRNQEAQEAEAARLRKIKRETEDELEDGTQDDDELSDYMNGDDDDDEEDEEEEEEEEEYLIGRRAARISPELSAAERTLRLKT